MDYSKSTSNAGMISIYMFLCHPQIVYIFKKLNNSDCDKKLIYKNYKKRIIV